MAGCGTASLSASSIVPNIASGCHILRIDGYSRTLTKPTGEHLKSRPFTVGGHRWEIRYYPNGSKSEAKDCISIFLYQQFSVAKPVKVEFKFHLICNTGEQEQPFTREAVHSFRKDDDDWGWVNFIKREVFEASKYLHGDSFAIRCDLAVIDEFLVADEPINKFLVEKVSKATAMAAKISVPPSDLQQHLCNLLWTKKGADVMFDVAGETFAAHRCVLAARSPVFSAELFGAMKESDTGGVVHIEDMEPWVFKALLYFLYTDLFPNTKMKKEAEEGDDKGIFPQNPLTKEAEEGVDMDVLSQHLLVAADKYNLERLKLLCESKLCEYVNVDTVGTILALAEQHRCHELKKVCFGFLSSPANMRAAVASDGFKHLHRCCPSVVEELVAMLCA